MTTLLIKHADMLVTMDAQRREIADGGLFIRDGRVEQVGPTADLPATADEVCDLRGHLVLPGLVNLHLRIHVSALRSVPLGGLTTDSTDNTDNEFTISVPSVSSVVKRRLTRKKAAIERRSSFSCLWCVSWFSNQEL